MSFRPQLAGLGALVAGAVILTTLVAMSPVTPTASVVDFSGPTCRTGHVRAPERGPAWTPAHRLASERALALATDGSGRVSGRDGWTFYDDSQVYNFSQALGRVQLTSNEADRWARTIRQLKRAAEAGGGHFAVVIAPAKWDVYADKLPRWADDLQGPVSFDALLAAHPELPLIDVRGPLRTARDRAATYSPLNSHWTDFGAWVAWRATLRCLGDSGALTPQAAPVITGVDHFPDRSEWASQGLTSTGRHWTAPRYAEPHPPTTVTKLHDGMEIGRTGDDTIDLLSLPVITRTPGSPDRGTLLVLRDSTGNSMSALWSRTFSRTVQIGHPFGTGATPESVSDLATRYRPTLTLLVMTERYLANVPRRPRATIQ